MIDEIIKDADVRMSKSIDSLHTEFTRIRTGRAHPSLLDQINVDYYGAATPINQVANVNVEDSRTLVVTPWEKDMVAKVEKAIMGSDLGLNPATAGTVIRIPMPPLTEERRKDLVKVVRHEAEQARVAIRNIRRNGLEDLRSFEKEGLITEDDLFYGKDELQKITDDYIKQVDEIGKAKEEEIMEV